VAGSGSLHSSQNGVGYFHYLARTITGRTGFKGNSFSLYFALYFYFFLNAMGNLLKRKLYFDAKVASLHPALASAAAKTTKAAPTESTTEDIAKLAEDIIHVHAAAIKAACTVKCRRSILVVTCLFVRIA
jgi:hypothetical protein